MTAAPKGSRSEARGKERPVEVRQRRFVRRVGRGARAQEEVRRPGREGGSCRGTVSLLSRRCLVYEVCP